MIYSVHGKLIAKEPAMAVVECGGVGYACRTTLHTLGQVGNLGETVLLYTAMSVREDAVELFGFSTQQELQCFQLLTSVSGVGPKAALAILSVVTPDQFTLAVMTQDVKTLTMAQGVGKKLAERIMLELKGKFTPAQMEANVAQMDLASPVRGSKTAEATAALSSLGYSQQEIAAALKGVDINAMTVEDMVRHALRAMVMQ